MSSVKGKMFVREYTEHRRLISQFNEHPNTVFLQKLLDIRECGMDIFVPKQFHHYLRSPTQREAHYKLTLELLEYTLLPPSCKLTETMKRQIKAIQEAEGACLDDDRRLKVDTSFWALALNPNRGSSKLYVWEHLLYREVMNDYLRRLESLVRICSESLPNFDKALEQIGSLHFFTPPVRFWLGEDGIFASENILPDYISTSFPNLYRMLFTSSSSSEEEEKEEEEEDDEEEEEGFNIVKAINPLVVEKEYPNYVKISDKEIDIIHNPEHVLDSSWTEEDGYSIYWWFPDSISEHLDALVIDSKDATGKSDDFL